MTQFIMLLIVSQSLSPMPFCRQNLRMENGGQRLATVLIYLSTPEEGGENVFPHAENKVGARFRCSCICSRCAHLSVGCLPDGHLMCTACVPVPALPSCSLVLTHGG
jgi:hypothetical protein